MKVPLASLAKKKTALGDLMRGATSTNTVNLGDVMHGVTQVSELVRTAHRQPLIFVSHSTQDAGYVRRLQSRLADRISARIFTGDSLRAGSNWQAQLRKNLANADLVVAVLTPSALDSDWVQIELGAAWALEKPIVPIVTNARLLSRVSVELGNAPVFRLEALEKATGMDDVAKALEHVLEESHVR